MARPLRIEIPGAWYYVTARGNERRLIFRGDRDFARFVEILEEMAGRYRVRLDSEFRLLLVQSHHGVYHLPCAFDLLNPQPAFLGGFGRQAVEL